MKNKNYYLGLDIGTDSVGYAVTDERYNLIKFKGEPMWGSHLFDAASQSSERRQYRTARRRLDRRQQRVKLVDEIFAPEVTKVDPGFYIRKQESALYLEDSTRKDEMYLYFNEKEYNDSDYHHQYPTIHHLITALMNEDKYFDIRLINIAVDWLVAHRGHFLSEVGESSLDRVLDFTEIYTAFMTCFDEIDEYYSYPWDTIEPEKLGEILKMSGINNKKRALKEFLYKGSIPKNNYFLDRTELIAFMSGGKVKCNKLFNESMYEEDLKISISDDMEELLPQLGDDADIIAGLAAMYDWCVLSDILAGSKYLSEAKVKVYKQHKKDLDNLKRYVKIYARDKYDEIFRLGKDKLNNYTAYSYNFKSVEDNSNLPKKKVSKDEFYLYLKKTLKLDKLDSIPFISEDDKTFVTDMLERMQTGTFMPKQVNGDNRVIPYQVYYAELKKILENAAKWYPFLSEKDKDGYTNLEKILSVFTFKIPYYVGPLRKDNSEYAWIERKAEGKIYPWNFEEMVDLDASEESFINRMTNTCTYIPEKSVLPKHSILYSKYTVLNEINNIKVNNLPISVKAKQGIYEELFCQRVKVTPKQIKDYLLINGYMSPQDEMTGIDITIKSSMKSRYDFRTLLAKGILSEKDVEMIISRSTYAEDRGRYRRWIESEFPKLSTEDRKYISRLKYKEFGRLSEYFLTGLEGTCKSTGEIGTIMHFLWTTNDNLMQILSNQYTFEEEIEKIRKDYYTSHRMNITDQMNDLGLSNAVKRPVTRTLDIVKDVVTAMGCKPEKIFVEMARGDTTQKPRTLSRKDQILELYKNVEADTSELQKQLEELGDTANNQLQSDKLFLYYMQLGRSMYSGKSIDLMDLATKRYDIDHIYPQCFVKDDSLLNNRVLVLSKENGDKGDRYPIDADIRQNMYAFWKMLVEKGLITKEKYSRLIRKTCFTDEEKLGFINRQLVETRQSMKAVAQLLKNRYQDTEIVYVKAHLVSDFRQEFKLTRKSRIINDLHHAKDAYLNVVVGNVYHEKFTKMFARNGFAFDKSYSVKTKTIFTHDLKRGEKVIWDHKHDLAAVKNTYDKNNAHLTRYAFCVKGGLFDQNPVKKGLGQVSIKEGMDIAKYGGYNKSTASFFVLTKFTKGKNKEIAFVPVELRFYEKFFEDDKFAIYYIEKVLQKMNTKKISDVVFPLGKRPIKIKTVISLDGYKLWINGKANNGKRVLLTSAESLVLQNKYIEYVRDIENYSKKKKENNSFLHDQEHDRLSETMNIELYDILTEKLHTNHFKKLPGNQYVVLKGGREQFLSLDFDQQITVLLNCITLMKSGRAGGVDLTGIGGKKSSGVVYMNASISSSSYKDIRIIDMSPAGIRCKTSDNLLEL